MKLRAIAILCSFSVLNACSDDDADTDAMGDAGPSSGGTGGSDATGGSGGKSSGGGGSGGTSGSGGSGGSDEADAQADAPADEPLDPDTASEVEVDRFSEDAATLMVRTEDNGLPEANEPIDFDEGPFITHGLGPGGEKVSYYNFDVQSTEPAPIYVLFKDGEDTPVDGQLNIVDVIPGSPGYNDFWQVVRVTVPDDYVANTVTSLSEIEDEGFETDEMDVLVNCPIVPAGSTADMRLGDETNGLIRGWYRDQVVHYFTFEEAMLSVDGNGQVPLSPIYVTFNENPPEGGPPSGFVTEDGTDQTHNVVATLPDDEAYSPLWNVNVYDNADFDSVEDLASAEDANILATGAAKVNCPIVSVDE